MALTTKIKFFSNKILQVFNLRLATLTAKRQDRRYLEILEERGHFERSIFTLPPGFQSINSEIIFKELEAHAERFRDFESPSKNDVGYTFDNVMYTSPDAEVLYAFIRRYQPKKLVEIGSGNSTRIIKQAVLDGRLSTEIISIDPSPRVEIKHLVNRLYTERVEILEDPDIFSLGKGDILFIDSSHKVRTGGDIPFIYLNVIPNLRPGVLIHIHDIFLPYEYPKEWILDNHWVFDEQYLVHTLLMNAKQFDVLWAAYFLQKTKPDFPNHFPHMNGRSGSSLWLLKKG
jgi:predicted O-methyltransferase YrrM